MIMYCIIISRVIFSSEPLKIFLKFPYLDFNILTNPLAHYVRGKYSSSYKKLVQSAVKEKLHSATSKEKEYSLKSCILSMKLYRSM